MYNYEYCIELAAMDNVTITLKDGRALKYIPYDPEVDQVGWYTVEGNESVSLIANEHERLDVHTSKSQSRYISEDSRQQVLAWGLTFNTSQEAKALKPAYNELIREFTDALEIWVLKDLRLAEKDRNALLLKIEQPTGDPEKRLLGYMLGTHGNIEKHTVAQWRYRRVAAMDPLFPVIMNGLKG